MNDRNNHLNYYEVLVIGGGPAGIAAAIQLHRSDVSTLILEKEEIGGLLLNANRVENYLGFPEGISGRELVKEFKKQLSVLGVKVRVEGVESIEYEESKFKILTNKAHYFAKYLIIATGTRPKKLPYTFSEEVQIRVFYESYRMINLENKEIIIIGGGDAAFDQALNLAKNNKVTILNRSNQYKCLPLLHRRVRANNQITYRTMIEVNSIEEAKEGLLLKCIEKGQNISINCDFVLGAIGREPALDFNLTEEELVNDLIEKTRLFYIGDVKNDLFRQTTIAAGEGITAAMKIIKNKDQIL
ncbi:MAG: NAD(P)/FAD-dependent oxidoreductase [Candidatus Heimdallarchaeota archaeon]|nr:NAD(P)/FAD-dependent oxidoreductase [Candidatus Heimdallarchaeota archaeon]MCK5048299.1 NAD(P)/FAD-dependent oxidoreductase [Candidatus Heimdallarchaeota archaeon]